MSIFNSIICSAIGSFIGVILGCLAYDFMKGKIVEFLFLRKILKEQEKTSKAILDMAEASVKEFKEKSDQSFINRMEMDKKINL